MTNKETFPLSLKVALIDDSSIVVHRLRLLLSELCNVQVVGNAANVVTARQLLKEQNPAVVVLDISLEGDTPATNGMSLLAETRAKYPHIVIIMLTNLASKQYREKCLQLGADYFFDKSNEFEKVIDIIKTLPFHE